MTTGGGVGAEIPVGAEVITIDGQKLGTVKEVRAGRFQVDAPMRTDIWLTPFDLGVRQHLKLLIHPGQFPDIYEVEVVLERISGDDGSWYRMNRAFLTLLRQQFLQWRSLSPERMKQYVEASRSLRERAGTPA